jgi:hypothetical protein
MSPRIRALLFAGLTVTIACSDRATPSTAPPLERVATTAQAVQTEPLSGVGTFGTVEEISKNEKKFTLRQLGFGFDPAPGKGGKLHKDSAAVGGKHQLLQVHIRGTDSTRVYRKGGQKIFDSLVVGDTVLVLGRVTGAALHADLVSDFTGVGEPVDSITSKLPPDTTTEEWVPDLIAMTFAADEPLSRCFGHNITYEANTHEFQGCWGGPMQAGKLNTPFIALFCPLIGCFGIDYLSYTVALGGWGYAFPFTFDASAPGLTYHVPGDVALSIQPKAVPDELGFSFVGGIGFAFGVNIDFCSFFGCYDIHTLQLSEFSMIHQSSNAGPLEGHMDIGEAGCPSVGVIPVDLPINPLSIGFCEDLGLNGKPFSTLVHSVGAANPAVYSWREFQNASQTVRVRPDAMQVKMAFSDFDWRPGMTMGLAFRFKIFSVPVYTTPSIPFGEVGLFDAVTTPFPLPGQSIFTLARNPSSPPEAPTYYYHPTSVEVDLAVAPALTTLRVTSTQFLVEGTPVSARLSESYDGSSIVGQPVVIQADGLGGTPSVAYTIPTGAGGVASVVLPVGEYNVTARFAGAAMYVPSTHQMTPVYVYRPTTFVIWGGNADGIATGSHYQFWGSGWAKQVTGGAYDGNSSFHGFALLTSSGWESPPASSGRGPESVPDLIAVIITTAVQNRGSRSSGNVAGHAVLRVDDPLGYRSDGGHASTGAVRAVLP